MLKRLPLTTILGTAAATVCVISLTSQNASAFGVSLGKWSYVRDSFTDSTGFASSDPRSSLYTTTAVGGTDFEIYGMAMRQDGNTISVALNANLGVGGWTTSDTRVAKNTVGSNAGIRNIGWGELIFNFSGKSKLSEATPNQLFGIKFGQGNDSGLQAGLYSNITLKSVTSQNSGWGKMSDYNNFVDNHIGTTTGKNSSSLGELASNSSYFDQSKAAPTSIATGTKVANDNFKMLDANALTLLGLNFGQGLNAGSSKIGSQTFGFSFTKTEAMKGNFIASLFEECGNDGIAADGSIEAVPEPTTIMGTILGGVGLLTAKRKRNKMAQ